MAEISDGAKPETMHHFKLEGRLRTSIYNELAEVVSRLMLEERESVVLTDLSQGSTLNEHT